ncbi:MAG: NAD(P)/FAD-dependent oxidoreductase [Actinomycetota bacterium]
MKTTSDAIIIGAGVIGAATAFELCKRGYRTLNIDKLPGAGYGPTSSSCSIVRAHYSSWDGVAMAHEGFSYWRDWPNYLEIDTDGREIAKYMQCGTVLLKSKTGHHEKVLTHFRNLGVDHEEWDTEQLKERIPYYDVHAFWPPSRPEGPDFWRKPEEELEGAIYTSGSGYVNDPQLATRDLQLAAEAKGGRFLFDERIVEIRRSGGRVLGVTLASGQEIDAPVVVNVAGPHSFVINRMAGVEETMNIKTRALRHEVHIVPAPPGVDYEHEGFHTSDGDQGIYFRPEAGNNILIGSEDPACDPQVWLEEPDIFDREVTKAQYEAQVYRVARRIPGLEVPSEPRGLADLYDVSDDWIPLYDRSDLDGFYMAVGTSGNQFKNAPPVGHLMAELIDACENGHDHDADAVQVKMPYTGVVLNAGFYSRNREINPNSSFSVNG